MYNNKYITKALSNWPTQQYLININSGSRLKIVLRRFMVVFVHDVTDDVTLVAHDVRLTALVASEEAGPLVPRVHFQGPYVSVPLVYD